jgi:hypothetical protein
MGLFNSREFEFADVTVSIMGKELTGLRGLEYDYEQDKEFLYAASNKPKSIQPGQIKTTGTLTVLKSDFDDMNTAARAAGYKNIVKVPGKFINITCVYQMEDGDLLRTDTLLNVEFTKWADGGKSGDKFKDIELPFLYLDIKQA